MLDLYLLRHGETALNERADTIGGQSNHVLLTDRGVLQARALGERLAVEGLAFDAVYVSPAERTRHTAAIVCARLGIPAERIIFSERLYELSQGDWEGKPRAQVYTPEAVKEIDSMNGQFCPPNGESQMMVEERMFEVVRELLNRKGPVTAAMVGHGTAFKCLLRRIMGFPPTLTYKIALDNASITQVKHSERGWHPIRMNDAAHVLPIGKMQDVYAPRKSGP